MGYILLKGKDILAYNNSFKPSPEWVETEREVYLGADGKYHFNITNDEKIKEIKEELEKIDKLFRTPRTLSMATLGDLSAITRLKKAEEMARPLRIELERLEKNS